MSVKKKVMFVDDQQNVLSGLKRMLHKMRDHWDMEFCNSGDCALEKMKEANYDLIVSDMIMPGMNGAQLLRRVNELYPGTVRFILSGHTERELVLESVGYAHQYISKPCDPDMLKIYLNKSLGIKKILVSEAVHKRIAEIKSLPSPPAIYNELILALQNENTSISTLADIISKDISLTAKILQMVNSAFFGLPTQVDNTQQAINFLGLDTLKGIILSAGVFNQFDSIDLPEFSIESMYTHSIAVGTCAKNIATSLNLVKRECDDAYLAGMMHDIGRIILLTNFKDEMKTILEISKKENIVLQDAEEQILGTSHAEIGAHLLSLWGLSDNILEAVAFHHKPAKADNNTPGPLTAVYLADVFLHKNEDDHKEHGNEVDNNYIENLHLKIELQQLQATCELEVA